jgi:hypothetical protein
MPAAQARIPRMLMITRVHAMIFLKVFIVFSPGYDDILFSNKQLISLFTYYVSRPEERLAVTHDLHQDKNTHPGRMRGSRCPTNSRRTDAPPGRLYLP